MSAPGRSTRSIRVWVNYPYPWQATRQLAVWACLTAFGTALGGYASARFNLGRRLIGIGAAVALAAYFLQSGFDTRTASGVACTLATAVALLARVRGRQRGQAWTLAAALLPWPFLAFWNSPGFLDNAVYVFASAALSLVGSDLVLHPRDPSDTLTTQATVSLDGKKLLVDAIVALHAAGNYVEAMLTGGERELLRSSLSVAIEQAPGLLIRVHRSHAVNVQRARRLRARRGSRYVLELDDGSELPVGRSFAPEVRDRLSLSGS